MHAACGLPTGSVQNYTDGWVHSTDDHRDTVMSAVEKQKTTAIGLVFFPLRFSLYIY